jgi:hypothetical protein
MPHPQRRSFFRARRASEVVVVPDKQLSRRLSTDISSFPTIFLLFETYLGCRIQTNRITL